MSGSTAPPVANPDSATTNALHGVWIGLTNNDTDLYYYALTVTSLGLAGTKGLIDTSLPSSGIWYVPGPAFTYLSLGESATDSFTYTISDGHGGSATSTATVTINGVNQAPTIVAAAAAIDASHAATINLLANASDVNRDDTLTVTALNLAGTKGTVTLGAGGVATYTPGAAFQYLAAGATAADSFAYTVSDNHGATTTGTETVTVTGTWQPPTAVADTSATDAKHSVTLNVLANDSDPQSGQTLSVTALNLTGTKGTATFTAGGAVTYNPGNAFLGLKAGAIATDSFSYTVSDAHGVSSTSTVTVTVTGVNSPPVANPDSAITDAAHGVWLGLANNDTDPNRDPLAVTGLGTTGTKGSVSLNPSATNGAYYVPGAAFAYLSLGESATDSFTYTVSDGQGGTAIGTATVTINGVNKAPTTTAGTAGASVLSAATINLLANASDVNRDDTLTVTALNLAGTKGTVTLGAGGVATYTPGAAFQYLAAGATATDSFAYTVSDNHGATTTGTETVTITQAWQPPTAVADTSATDAKHGVTVNVLANDSDPQSGQTLSVTALNLTGTKGTATFTASGAVTYNPGTAFLGLKAGAIATDSFGYTVSDAHGAFSTSTVTITITGVNSPPVANPDTATTDAAHGVPLNLIGNDTDPNGDPLTVTSLDTSSTKGSVTLSPTGGFYTPGTAFAYLSLGESATDSVTYTVSDGQGGTATSTATVTITGVNQAPIAAAGTAAIDASHAATINLLANDSDVNRDDTLTVTALNLAGTKGTVTLGAGGVATYTPGAAFQYLAAGATAADSFTYTVSDNHGATTTGTETVTVTGTWQPPTAVADTSATDAKHSVTVNVLANDSDPQSGQTLSVTALNLTGTKGTATFTAGGAVTYNPVTAFLGLKAGATATDSFSYTVSDAQGFSSTSTVTVTITGVNSPPVANPDTASTNAATGVWINLVNNDTDPNGDPLTVTSLGTAGTKASVTLSPTGGFYTPGAAFAYLSVGESATDSFTYTISDGQGGTAASMATVTVSGVNQAPTAAAGSATVYALSATNLNLLANASDVNRDDTLTVTALNLAGTKGVVTLGAGGIATYTPGAAFQSLAAGATATDSFAYTVSDNHGATTTGTETVTIIRTWQSPIAVADTAAATDAKHSVTLNVLANDSDPQSGQTLSVTALNLAGTKGTATFTAGGAVTYNPGSAFLGVRAGATATDSFGYTVTDAYGFSTTSTVTVTIAGSNWSPVANPDSATTDALHGVWIGLTNNDTDLYYYALTVTSLGLAGTKGLIDTSLPSSGIWYVPGTAFTYLSLGESATDSFTYTISDGHGGTATSTATVTINGVNQAPTIIAAATAIDASHAATINLLANASDVNRDDTLTVTALNLAGTKGTVTLGAGGVATYTPGAAFQYLAAGATAADSFAYTVSDNHGATTTGTETVTVTGTWQPPTAVADTSATDAKHSVTVNVLANDSDPQSGQTLSVTALNLTGTKGTATFAAGGAVTYNPGTAFLGLKAGATATDSFGYTVSDAHGVSSTSTVTVTVTGVNSPPVANPDSAITDAAHGVWLGLANNDTDPNGDPLAVTALGTTVTKGTVILNPAATGGAYYDPATAFAYLSLGESATDSFTYTVSDGQGGTAIGTATVTITGVNQAPTAAAGTAAIDASHAAAINLLANASDVNRDDTLTVTTLNLAGTKGTVTLGAGGVATYTPGAAFQYLAAGATAADSFTYTVSDNHGATITGTETVTVTGTWQPPTAVADTSATDAKHSVTVNVLANDSDPQSGQTLSVTALNLTGTKGTATFTAGGAVTYIPGTAFLGLKAGATATDSFGYTVSDAHGVSSTGTVTVTITGVNSPPVATPDTAATDATHGVWLGLANNDTDPNGDPLTVTALGIIGTKGTVSLNPTATGGAYYDPATAFAYLSVGESAIDSFTYTISDGQGGTATSTATVTVNGVNKAPVAVGDNLATTAPQAVSISLLANDSDVNRDDTLSVTALNLAGTKGVVTLGAGGVATYTPGAAFQYLAAGTTATDSFSYTVSDNHGATATATETIAVTGTWLPPVATADTATTDSQHAVTIRVLANDTDPQSGQTLSVASLNLAGTDGTAVVNADGTVTYTPGAAFAGLAPGSSTSDTFADTISDGHGSFATSTVTVKVTAPGASPSAPAAFYVATNGNDAWSGRLAQPNAAGTDGPLATLQAAQGKMAASTTTKTTYVEGGDYYLTSSLALNSSDSGESWLAMPGQTPVLHGGQQITGWVQGGNGIWTAQAPAGAFAQGGAVADLFLNGTRETLARYPNYAPANPLQGGWLAAAASLPGQTTTSSFQFNAGDIPTLASTTGLYVDVYEQDGWQNFTLPVASINYATDTITLAGSTDHAIGAGSRYFIYDAPSQLDSTNEWFYDPASNTVSFKAPAGFTGGGVTVGSLPNIVTINGASNVTLAGLTIEGSTSTGTGILATSSSGLTVAGNRIVDVGNAITFAGTGGTDDIEGNEIANTENMGITVSPGTNNLVIKGNSIHDIGQLLNGGAIWFTGSSNDTITNNLVQNVARGGIAGGSAVGASDASYNDRISYNVIANTNQATSDGGAIYIGGQQQNLTGDVVSFNDIYGTTALGTALSPQLSFLNPSQLVSFGVYLDDYASGVTVTGNLLHDNLGGVLIHSGWNNTISDNILVNDSVVALENSVANWRGAGVQAPANNLFTGNLVSNATAGALIDSNEGDPVNASWSGNFYNVAGLSPAAFVSYTNQVYKAQSLATWQAAGFDSGATSGNPNFVDTTSYALAASSPALALGITSPPVSQMGLSGFVASNSYDLFGH